jgi:hypothetical protein
MTSAASAAQHRVHLPGHLPLPPLQNVPYVFEVSTIELCPRRFLTSSSVNP